MCSQTITTPQAGNPRPLPATLAISLPSSNYNLAQDPVVIGEPHRERKTELIIIVFGSIFGESYNLSFPWDLEGLAQKALAPSIEVGRKKGPDAVQP